MTESGKIAILNLNRGLVKLDLLFIKIYDEVGEP